MEQLLQNTKLRKKRRLASLSEKDKSAQFPNNVMRQHLKNKFKSFPFKEKFPSLHVNNYSEYFRTLLQMEDLCCMLSYVPLTLFNHPFELLTIKIMDKIFRYFISVKIDKKSRWQSLLQPGMAEAIIVKASKLKRIQKGFKHPVDILMYTFLDCEQGEIFQIVDKTIIIEIDKPSFFEDREAISIIFRPNRFFITLQYEALDYFKNSPRLQDYLYPENVPNTSVKTNQLKKEELINSTVGNNPEQLAAVNEIVYGSNTKAPFIIFGPPGTGKTTTIVESILQVCLKESNSFILVTSNSNAACDAVAARICYLFNKDPQLEKKCVSSEFEGVLQCEGECKSSGSEGDCEPKLQSGGCKKTRCPIVRAYASSKKENRTFVKSIDPLLKRHSNIKSFDLDKEGIEEVLKYRIIVTTMCCFGLIGKPLRERGLTHVFIDEVGACTEPEALVGISIAERCSQCKVIIAGDHKQLGPVIESQVASRNGLNVSLMERIINNFECYKVDSSGDYNRTCQVRLRRNYRSHHSIVNIYNHLYYNNELIPEATHEDINLAKNWKHLSNPNFPIVFQPVYGKFQHSSKSTSSYNNDEINEIFCILQSFQGDGFNGKVIVGADIGIVSPYKEQYEKIEKRLKTENNWKGIRVGSAEIFQGREKKIIIVSMVRSFSNALGFIGCPKRLNVILSRAQALLIIVGNPSTLNLCPDLKYILDQCYLHGTALKSKNTEVVTMSQKPSRKSIKKTNKTEDGKNIEFNEFIKESSKT